MSRALWLTGCMLVVLSAVSCSGDGTANPGGCEEPICDEDPSGWPRFTDEGPAWSPDGGTLAYFHGGITSEGDTSGIYFVTPQGTGNRLFLAGLCECPDWSPDGEWLAFSWGGRIYKVKANGESLMELTVATGRHNWYPDWSPDGKVIAYSCSSGDHLGLWIIPAWGQAPWEARRVTDSGVDPDWSHSGYELVYLGFLDEGNGICIVDTLGINPRLLFGDAGDRARHPVFSPDDSKIAFEYAEEGQGPQIWVMNADGSEPTQLTTCGGGYPAWSPDGEYIVYTDTRLSNGRLWIMKTDGTCKRQITLAEWWCADR